MVLDELAKGQASIFAPPARMCCNSPQMHVSASSSHSGPHLPLRERMELRPPRRQDQACTEDLQRRPQEAKKEVSFPWGSESTPSQTNTSQTNKCKAILWLGGIEVEGVMTAPGSRSHGSEKEKTPALIRPTQSGAA